jgi:ribose 5-phosphate isomerase A
MKDDSKRRAAERAIEFVREGQVVGLGTGSTTIFAINLLGQMVQQGLRITGVATSKATERLAAELGIPLSSLNDVEAIDITIDGADEVDPGFNMIKGGGGALTREKLVAIASRRRVIIVDETKLVERLGRTRSLPVEVLPFAWRMSARLLTGLGCKPVIRERDGEAFETDNGNYILDSDFGEIADPAGLERAVKQVPGVVESGLFVGIADVIIVGFDERVEIRERSDHTA